MGRSHIRLMILAASMAMANCADVPYVVMERVQLNADIVAELRRHKPGPQDGHMRVDRVLVRGEGELLARTCAFGYSAFGDHLLYVDVGEGHLVMMNVVNGNRQIIVKGVTGAIYANWTDAGDGVVRVEYTSIKSGGGTESRVGDFGLLN